MTYNDFQKRSSRPGVGLHPTAVSLLLQAGGPIPEDIHKVGTRGTVVRSLFALSCAIALAGILISPAVPSLPTLVGKSVHQPVASQIAIAILRGALPLATVIAAILQRTGEIAGGGSRSGCQAGFQPLRR